MKVKIFYDNDSIRIEKAINSWLESFDPTRIKIIKILQSETEVNITITIFYKDT